MDKIILFLVIIGLISSLLKGVVGVIVGLFLYVVLPVIGAIILFLVFRWIYHLFNPDAKKAYLERKTREAESRVIRERQEAEKQKMEFNIQQHRDADQQNNFCQKMADTEKFNIQQHRDADQQTTPYTYKLGKHGNESLAIRYGIANQERKVKQYWYNAKGGEQKRNPDRDKVYYEPAGAIRLQKTKKVSKDLYEVLLTDFRDRRARAIIEVGTEYVKTFYPLDDSWFEKNADLEETLKGNNSFTLKELATFHVQKTVGT